MIICFICDGRATFDHFDKANGLKIYHCVDCGCDFYGAHRTPEQIERRRLEEESNPPVDEEWLKRIVDSDEIPF